MGKRSPSVGEMPFLQHNQMSSHQRRRARRSYQPRNPAFGEMLRVFVVVLCIGRQYSILVQIAIVSITIGTNLLSEEVVTTEVMTGF